MFTFVITVSGEESQQLDWCLRNLKNVYCHAPVTVILDGEHPYACRYEAVCKNYRNTKFVRGQKLKIASAGAAWWIRFFEEALKYDTPFYVKIDPDTFIRSPLGTPPGDICGCLQKNDCVQGGFHCFSKQIVHKILESGLLLDNNMKNWEYWMPENIPPPNDDYFSTDWSMWKVSNLLGIPNTDWSEIHSFWQPGPRFRFGSCVTHPHKNDYSLPSVAVVVCNYKRPENVKLITEAFWNNSIPNKVYVLDASEEGIEVSGCEKIVVHNRGAWNRFCLPPSVFQYDYIYFHDDDLLPGETCLEFYVRHYMNLGNPGVIGQFGRIFGDIYNANDIALFNVPQKVTSLIRSYFLSTEVYLNIMPMFHKYKMYHNLPCDDLIMSLGASKLGYSNYVTIKPNSESSFLELNSSDAECNRLDHYEKRHYIVSKINSRSIL